MGKKVSVSDEECIEALRSAEPNTGMSAKEIVSHILSSRKASGVPAATKGAVISKLQVMGTALDPKVVVNKTTTPYLYSLKLQEQGEGPVKKSPENPAADDDSGSDDPAVPPRVRMLREDRAFCRKIWDAQGSYGFPRDQRKTREELEVMTHPDGVKWLEEVEALKAANLKEMNEKMQKRVDEAVAKAMVTVNKAIAAQLLDLEQRIGAKIALGKAMKAGREVPVEAEMRLSPKQKLIAGVSLLVVVLLVVFVF